VAYPAPSAPGTPERLHSLRIDVSAQDGQGRGLHQTRVPVRAGTEYRGSLWVRSQDFAGRLTAVLGQDRTGGDVYAMADAGEIAPGGTWEQFRFGLRPSQADPLARLAITLSGRGRVWIDQVSLMPGDAVDEVRADVFDRIRRFGLPLSAGRAGTSPRTTTGSGASARATSGPNGSTCRGGTSASRAISGPPSSSVCVGTSAPSRTS
jgi:hypothetical protein